MRAPLVWFLLAGTTLAQPTDLLAAHPGVHDCIDYRDANGLTALDHASLAAGQSLVACHFNPESSFVPILWLVKRPYYEDRAL